LWTKESIAQLAPILSTQGILNQARRYQSNVEIAEDNTNVIMSVTEAATIPSPETIIECRRILESLASLNKEIWLKESAGDDNADADTDVAEFATSSVNNIKDTVKNEDVIDVAKSNPARTVKWIFINGNWHMEMMVNEFTYNKLVI
jgi:hypothetical protein